MSSCKYQKCLMLSLQLRSVQLLTEVLKSKSVKPPPPPGFTAIDRRLASAQIRPDNRPPRVAAAAPKIITLNLCCAQITFFLPEMQGIQLTA